MTEAEKLGALRRSLEKGRARLSEAFSLQRDPQMKHLEIAIDVAIDDLQHYVFHLEREIADLRSAMDGRK